MFCIVVVLVGAVGIENNNVRNFKDLRGIRRNAKSLKRNDGTREGILIAPSKLPRFSRSPGFLHCSFLPHRLEQEVGFGAKFRTARMASRLSLLMESSNPQAFLNRQLTTLLQLAQVPVGPEGQLLSLKSPSPLIALNLDDKIGELLRAIENQLMWHVRGDAHYVPRRQFLPRAALNRPVAFLVWRGGFRVD